MWRALVIGVHWNHIKLYLHLQKSFWDRTTNSKWGTKMFAPLSQSFDTYSPGRGFATPVVEV